MVAYLVFMHSSGGVRRWFFSGVYLEALQLDLYAVIYGISAACTIILSIIYLYVDFKLAALGFIILVLCGVMGHFTPIIFLD